VAGFGSVGTQILVNAFVAGHYPAGNRATALGWSLGIGRLGAILGPTFGGIVLASVQGGSLGFGWNFYAFAIPALLGVVVVLLVPRSPTGRRPVPSRATEEERSPSPTA
jgi:AAHS family benzoate transporter-like MFS transporter